MYKTFPNDSKVKQLKKNFNPDVIKEGIDNPSYTSYTINKGQEIILCLRTNGQLVDINVLTFVCIHELSHIGNETVGHDDAFWQFFKELLTGKVIEGVKFDIPDLKKTGESDIDGFGEVPSLKPKKAHASFVHPLYEVVEMDVEPKKGKTVVMNVEMKLIS